MARSRAELRFYAQVNDFLPVSRRGQALVVPFDVSPAVKDLIESCGVPHAEVGLVVVNGAVVTLARQMKDGDRVEVYPRPAAAFPPRKRFLLDVHLGRLARDLRMLGFDAEYANDLDDPTLAERAEHEERILLTRDVGLLKRSRVTHGHWVRATQPREQLAEIVRLFGLLDGMAPLTRCLVCNAVLERVRTGSVTTEIPADVRASHAELHVCPACKRVYWRGTHQAKMEAFVKALREALRPSRNHAA